jgi:RHS repeat-associated protein
MGLIDGTTGVLAARWDYEAFGITTTTVEAAGPFGHELCPFRFSSKYRDVETGLCYYGYRYYSPETGRWTSRDPIEEQGGINLYGMCGNDPVNYWDKLGLEWFMQLDKVEGNMHGKSDKAEGQTWTDKIGKDGNGHGQTFRTYAAVTAVEKVNELRWTPGFSSTIGANRFNSVSHLAKENTCHKTLYLFLVAWNERGYKYGAPPTGAFQSGNNTYLRQIVQIKISPEGNITAKTDPAFDMWSIPSEPFPVDPRTGQTLRKINGGGAIGSQFLASASLENTSSWSGIYDAGGGWSDNGNVYWTRTGFFVGGGAGMTQNVEPYPGTKNPNQINDTQANSDAAHSRPKLTIKIKKVNK